jgi:hypothetical protein
MAGVLDRLRRLPAAPVTYAMLALAIAGSLAYWPGLMIWDSARQYEQALSGAFDDWHPPAMEWIWRLWTGVAKGPAPMLATQLALYAGGFVLMIRWALALAKPRRALALAACALLPLSVALMAEVIKDSLMTGVLVCATGLWLGAAEGARGRKLAAAALVLAAGTLRYNAFLAGAPLLFALAPVAWRGTRLRQAGVALAAGAALLVVMPVANRLLHAEKSGVEESLVIFDLGGIGYHSGQNVFPPLDVADPVKVNRACYNPEKWDSYAEWVDPICAIHFDAVRDAFEDRGLSARRWWIGAILAHPVAYLEHRFSHWNINAGFLVHREAERAVQVHSDPNPGNYKVPDTAAVHWVDRLARWSARTPLGWPACWMALGVGLLILAPRLPSGRWVWPLALSGLLYGLGYGPFSVATDERYYFWTMAAVALAAALALTDGVDWRSFNRRRLLAAVAPVVVVALLSGLWRVF